MNWMYIWVQKILIKRTLGSLQEKYDYIRSKSENEDGKNIMKQNKEDVSLERR